ncbi:MAG: acyltransferase [Pseudomonadales bacterium]|nr:acyltransferase [Pseudomonadales bacterium]NRA14013.1 acyltransferase [Oceanospirillaceae bacterium]
MREQIQQLKLWIKTSEQPLALSCLKLYRGLIYLEIPSPKWLFKIVAFVHFSIAACFANFLRVFYWTPMFKSSLAEACSKLYLYGGMPMIMGPLQIRIGNNCRINGQTTFCGRCNDSAPPLLSIGNNVDISWQTTIAVGSQVIIGNNVRIAAKGFLVGYPGHPIDPHDRARGLADTDEQIGAIVLEDDVWLASNVTVLANVTIGAGTVVATGSIVTKDLPAGVLAAGVPAKIIKSLLETNHSQL